MIFDRIDRIGLYRNISPAMETAVSFITGLAAPSLPFGDFTVEDGRVYGFCRYFDLKPEGRLRYESHRRYIDIQYLLEGCEEMLCADTGSLGILSSYDPEKDIAFHEDAGRFVRLTLHPGDFAVFFPADAHKPCCAAEGCERSRKIVVKVAAE